MFPAVQWADTSGMQRLALFLVLVVLVFLVACGEATGPRYVLGPGCWLERDATADSGEVVTLRLHYPTCPQASLDSLQREGWRVVWDTTWLATRP